MNSTTASRIEVIGSDVAKFMQGYYEFSWQSVPQLAAHTWLMVLASLGIIIGLVKCEKLVIAALVWTITLYLIGNAYLLRIPFLIFTNLGAVLIILYLPIGLVTGSIPEMALTLTLRSSRWYRLISNFTVVLVFASGFIASHVRVTEIEHYRYFVTLEDEKAMKWIKENSPEDALFAVNTYFWLPKAPHGTDAGYWIPYFTGRQTTASVMLFSLGAKTYMSKIVELSQAVENLEIENRYLDRLREMGVDYIYIGKNGDFSGSGLNAQRLSEKNEAELVYQNDGIFIFRLNTD